MNIARRRDWASSAVLSLLVALVAIGCQTSGQPLPGLIHLTSTSPRAPRPLSLRIDRIGGPGISVEIEEGEEVVADWFDLPLPEEKWIEVNGQDCEGTFGIQERIETDLLLVLTDDGCRIESLGMHPRGDPHIGPAD